MSIEGKDRRRSKDGAKFDHGLVQPGVGGGVRRRRVVREMDSLRGGAMSVEDSLRSYGTYRCPVCGHRDGAVMDRMDSERVVSCPYCETPLELRVRGRDSGRFEAQVTAERARG